MMTEYPRVIGEEQTVEELFNHRLSIARFGDGELKMMEGQGYVREPANPALAAMLSWAFTARVAGCLVAIPTMNRAGPKYESWARSEKRFLRHLDPLRAYYSAFISRPDSAPWINTATYARAYQRLWLGKRAVVLCEKDGSAYRAVKIGSREVVHVRCPRHEAFSQLNTLENQILDASPEIAILSCGATASILAVRLAQLGVQAIDFGSGGSFIAKLLSQ